MPELLTLEDGKQHLRLFHDELDTEVESSIAAARDYCERHTQRTLRTSTTRTINLYQWWIGRLDLPYPPLLGVTSVSYYDEDDVNTVLASSNYHVVLSDYGAGFIEWTDDAEQPNTADRPDAVRILYTAGYASAATCPPVALQAMRTKLTEIFGVGTEYELKAAKDATDRLLNQVDWTGYA